jgi:hypothetical protein
VDITEKNNVSVKLYVCIQEVSGLNFFIAIFRAIPQYFQAKAGIFSASRACLSSYIPCVANILYHFLT